MLFFALLDNGHKQDSKFKIHVIPIEFFKQLITFIFYPYCHIRSMNLKYVKLDSNV